MRSRPARSRAEEGGTVLETAGWPLRKLALGKRRKLRGAKGVVFQRQARKRVRLIGPAAAVRRLLT